MYQDAGVTTFSPITSDSNLETALKFGAGTAATDAIIFG